MKPRLRQFIEGNIETTLFIKVSELNQSFVLIKTSLIKLTFNFKMQLIFLSYNLRLNLLSAQINEVFALKLLHSPEFVCEFVESHTNSCD